jgi:uncharacterized protein (DUF305 family)
METNKKILLGGGALILILIIVATVAILDRDDWGKSDGRNRYGDGRGEMMNHDMGMNGMHQMPDGTMQNSISERQFIEMMIPHHQEAVDTAKQVVARGENAEVKKLAEAIITAQEKEIADMKSWYKLWYGSDYKDGGTYKNMMSDLTTLSGNKLDRAFLEEMVTHHTGALEENQRVVPNLQHAEMQELVKKIAEAQSSEIITMRILLKQI